jgi:DNA polymerase III delta prime subunit
MEFTQEQERAIERMKDFLESKEDFHFLLTGPGGSGKTTVITSCLDGLKIAFTSFTNKAVRVLQNVGKKAGVDIACQTIHTLLSLEPYVSDGGLTFKYSRKRLDIDKYDVIVFDECSTISTQLLDFIMDAWEFYSTQTEKKIKFIFTGDKWQLPPVKERSCPVFNAAKNERWPIARLNEIMRGKNDDILETNRQMLRFIKQVRSGKSDVTFPYDMLVANSSMNFAKSLGHFYDKIVEEVQSGADSIALAYSHKCCDNINMRVRERLDELNNIERDPDSECYLVGDRFCVDKVTRDTNEQKAYPGDLFEVTSESKEMIASPFAKFSYAKNFLPGQILVAKRLPCGTEFRFAFIFPSVFDAEKKKIKNEERSYAYHRIMTRAMDKHPQLSQGYCLTVYKSQGSEWRKVFIELDDIWICCRKNSWMLIKATYTAVSRASEIVTVITSD